MASICLEIAVLNFPLDNKCITFTKASEFSESKEANSMKQLKAKVASNTECLPGIHLLRMSAPEIAAQSRTGQFVTIDCGPDTLLRRPLSIHRAWGASIELLFKVVGTGTQWLANQGEGSYLDMLGPLGNGFSIDADARHLLLVAGGIGIAPLVYLAEAAEAKGLAVKFIVGAADRNCLFPVTVKDCEVIPYTEDGSAGTAGLVLDAIPTYIDWADQLFACGPLPMYLAMAGMSHRFGEKPVQVVLEQAMGCGTGACRGCSIPTKDGMKMVCADGPVFDLRDIEWEAVTAPGILRI